MGDHWHAISCRNPFKTYKLAEVRKGNIHTHIYKMVSSEKENIHTHIHIQNGQLFVKLQNEGNSREVHHRYSTSTSCPSTKALPKPV